MKNGYQDRLSIFPFAAGYHAQGVINDAPVNFFYSPEGGDFVRIVENGKNILLGNPSHAQELVSEDARRILREHNGGRLESSFSIGIEEIEATNSARRH